MMPQKERRRLLFASPVRATSARRRQDVRPCGNGRSCPFLPPARAAASSPRKALPLPLRRLTRAPLPRTASPGALQTAPFPRPGEPSADRAPAHKKKAPPFPRHRRFCRSAPPSGAGKIVRAFPKAAEAAPPFHECFPQVRGTPHVGRSPAPWKMFFHRGRTDRSSNAV